MKVKRAHQQASGKRNPKLWDSESAAINLPPMAFNLTGFPPTSSTAPTLSWADRPALPCLTGSPHLNLQILLLPPPVQDLSTHTSHLNPTTFN